MSIKILRQQIDQINAEILKLLQKRAELAIKIGELKTENNQRVYNYDRESKILKDIKQKNKGPLRNESIKKIFQIIIKECRNNNSVILSEIDTKQVFELRKSIPSLSLEKSF